MKQRIFSFILTICMLITLLVCAPVTASATTNIKLGDYIQMGTYYGKPILWRCVAFEKIKGYDTNGNPIIDSMDTVTEYKDGYLPLMLSDKILCLKAFDAYGGNTSGSHGRSYYDGSYRKQQGSNHWEDSNMHCWLNSDASAGNVVWTCGNPPYESRMYSKYNEYDKEAGFLTNFTQAERELMTTVTQKSLMDAYEYSGKSYSYNSNHHQRSTYINYVVQNYATAFSHQVTDTVFLLDVKQINEVYNNRSILGTDYYIGEPTAECVANSEYKNSELAVGKKWNSWLRSPLAYYSHYGGHYVRTVSANDTDGNIQYSSAGSPLYGVRPAFYLTDTVVFSSGNGSAHNSFQIGDSTNTTQQLAEITYNGITYNLLSQPINIGKDSSAEVTVKVNYAKATGKEKIYLTQNTKKYIELTNNVGKTFQPTSTFEVGKDVYLLVVNEETGEKLSKRTRLNIIDSKTSGEWMPGGNISGLNFKLGKETGFTIPDSVPVFGGAEIKWDFDFIPISVEYDREDSNKINIVFGFNIAHSDGEKDKCFKDFDFKEYKKKIKKAASKQGRTFKQLCNDFKMSNAYHNHKMNLFGEKVIGGGTGNPSFDFDVAGYAEAKIIDGKLCFIEGQLCLDAEVSYNYQGQLFILGFPAYYEIGGGGSAGFEGNVVDITSESITPKFNGYLTAKIMANIGAGPGIANGITVGAGGEGSLNLKTALHREYVKSWGNGGANFNAKALGKEIFKLEFAKGNFLIFETGNPYGLLSSSTVTLASVDDKNLYSSIDIHKVYENESRAYASSPTEWYGDISPVRLMSTDYTNKNLQLLAENVYPESAPMLCNIDGQKVMVMLWDSPDRDDANRSMLVYSVYNEETKLWSQPVPVYDDGTADFYPCFQDGYLVWQNEKALLDNSMTLVDIAKLGEICVAKWDGNGFTVPDVLTNNNILDTQPVVCTSESEVSVVWIQNSDNDILGCTGTNSIWKADFNGSAWSEAKPVKEKLYSVVNLSAGYIDSGLQIAYVEDGDNDLQTINEREICIISENEVYQLTDNETLDSHPIFVGNMVYYYSDGNIHYRNLSESEVHTVFETSNPGLTDAFSISSNEIGETALWWSKMTDAATEIFCTMYKDGEWSDEIQISDNGNQARYPAGILEADGSMYIAYNNSIWQDGGIVQSDLYTLDLIPSYDLAITDAYIDEESMLVYTTVKNAGELNLDSYTVLLTDGEEINSLLTIDEPLKAGSTAEVVIQYNKPENLNKRNITVGVSTNVEEYNTENNTATLTVGSCDVTITEVKSYEALPDSSAVAVITNRGYSDTGKIIVYLREKTATGTIAKTKIIDNLAPGESKEVCFSYAVVGNENIQWYVTAEAENKEISLGNNDIYFINNYLSSISNYSHEILRYIMKDTTLTVFAHAENNTDSELSAVSILAIYDVDGNLKGVSSNDLSTQKYDSTTLDFTINHYTYTSGDYMKLFLWGDNLKPIIPAEQINVVAE